METIINSYLIILPNNLGDVIMATPVVSALKKKGPDCQIGFLVEAGYDEVLVNNPDIDTIHTLPRAAIRDSLHTDEWKKGLTTLQDFIHEINACNYSTIINFSQHPFCSFLASCLHAPTILGQHYLREGNHAVLDKWSQYLFSVPFARQFNHLHVIDIYKNIAGVGPTADGCRIYITMSERVDAGHYLTSKGIDCNKPCIVIQPGAAYPAKRWPIEHWITLCRLLVHEGWSIIVNGAQAERPMAEAIGAAIGQSIAITTGERSFKQSVAHLCFARGCVTPDTALMHAAAALNVTTYALFGPTNPVETGPYGPDHFVFSAVCSDKPCFATQCQRMLCMNGILPEYVIACIKEQIPKKSMICDIFSTGFTQNCYGIKSHIDQHDVPYIDASGAVLTEMLLFGEGHSGLPLHQVHGSHLPYISAFSNTLATMHNLLQKYLEDNDVQKIREFEQMKLSLTHIEGIGRFLTALLNIRLNSIPVFDAHQGIELSLSECQRTLKMLSFASSS